MPLDHYVSQVHLRNFYSPTLDGKKMHGFRKRDGHIFPCGSRDVCRVEDGSTNAYLLHERAIEEFLKTIEPNYDRAVVEFRNGKPGRDAIYTVAGFAAYVSSCSPTAMRLGADPLRNSVEATAKILDAQGQIPRAPDALGGKTITDLLADGIVNVTIDEKYPQAIGINGVMERLGIWGNCHWDVIVNDDANSPFFTSDFPTAIERSSDPRILNRIVPLAPDIAIRIQPNFAAKESRGDLSFPAFRCRAMTANHQVIRGINMAIVQCAEDLVFFRDQNAWVAAFLGKNRAFRIEPETAQIPVDRGFMNVSTMRIKPFNVD
jgi:Protein of unknown function (DUF4238)